MVDVLVIGAGMCGIAAAAALIFKGVRDIAVAGCQSRWARRSVDDLCADADVALAQAPAGAGLGIPSLTFRAWFEATRGLPAWDALYKIPDDISQTT